MRKDVGRAQRPVRPRDAAAGPGRDRRAQDEADPALGQGAPRHRHPARRHRPPLATIPVSDEIREKIALFTDVATEAVIPAETADTIYEVPLHVRGGRPRPSSSSASSASATRTPSPDLGSWRALVERIKAPKPTLEIALVGKYIELPDAYLSVTEALRHAAWAHGVDAKVRWVDSEALTHDNLHERARRRRRRSSSRAASATAASRARSSPPTTPASTGSRTSGLCLGPAVRGHRVRPRRHRHARTPTRPSSTCSPRTRSSTSCPTSATWRTRAARCGSGLYPARLTPGSKAAAVYGQEVIYERHRHRFEVNNRYRQTLEAAGMVLSGQSPDGRLVEIVELRDHPWFVASQFHPEFKSRPERPAPAVRRVRRGARSPSRDGREPVLRARESGPRPGAVDAGDDHGRADPRRSASSRQSATAPDHRRPGPPLAVRLAGRVRDRPSRSASPSGPRPGPRISWPIPGASSCRPTPIGAWLGVAFVLGALAGGLDRGPRPRADRRCSSASPRTTSC